MPVLLRNWSDGRLKMHITWKLLNFRGANSELFRMGDYIPLSVTGLRANHVVAFGRRLHEQWCIVAVPRLCASLTRAGTPPLGEKVWQDTQIELPHEAPLRWSNVLTGDALSSPMLASNSFHSIPVAVLLAPTIP